MYLIPFYVLALICGGVAWYFIYGLELWLNGMMKPNHLRGLWEELLWILPGGRRRRIAYVRKFDQKISDTEAAAMLPGLWHFLFTHVGLPLGPVCLVHMIASYFAG